MGEGTKNLLLNVTQFKYKLLYFVEQIPWLCIEELIL